MAIAALVSLPITAPIRRSLTFLRPSSSFPTSLSVSLRHQNTVKYPTSRIVASSMSIQAPSKTSSTSFLDNKESGFLYFAKYHGLGNDFILVDNRDSFEPRISPEQAVKICDRNFAIGADGVIFVMLGVNGTDYTMGIFNSDGSEPVMCGNAIRCFTKFVSQLENLHGRQSFTIHSGAGLIVPEVFEDRSVKVDMGEPILKASDIPTRLPANKDGAVVKSELNVDDVTWNVTCINMGNPHCVTFGTKGSQLSAL